MNHSETTTSIAEKVHDVILYDIWFNKKLNSRVNEYGQSPPVHVPSSIRVVDNIRIKNLWLNPCPVHLALLSFRAFHGEFDCPIDKVWAYRFAQATVSLDPFFCFLLCSQQYIFRSSSKQSATNNTFLSISIIQLYTVSRPSRRSNICSCIL